MRRTYYPGFFGALFLVLLRVAIGWHFMYEGLEKVDSYRRGGKPFTAEPYLRSATGPLAPYFRGLVPDVHSFTKVEPERLKARWKEEVRQLGDHYRFDDKQRAQAEAELLKRQAEAEIILYGKEFGENRQKYYDELRSVLTVERDRGALSFERERAAARRKDLDAARRELIKDIDAMGASLRKTVTEIATPEQQAAAGPYSAPRAPLDWVNLATAWGLVVMGFCLMAGLITRPAALAAAVFLGQIYLSMPPWPGLPPNPMAEGHYFIVNKNLVELLACLVLATLPTGRWVGVDALLFNWVGRRRARRIEERERAEERRLSNYTRPGV